MTITTNELITAEAFLKTQKQKAEEVWQDKLKNRFFETFKVEEYRKMIKNFIEICNETEKKINFAKSKIF